MVASMYPLRSVKRANLFYLEPSDNKHFELTNIYITQEYLDWIDDLAFLYSLSKDAMVFFLVSF